MRILVTGGAGFIGSHIVDRYIELGHRVIVIDNLSTGRRDFVNSKAVFYEADIRDVSKMQEILTKEQPEVLNHHAAQMDVRKSVADPKFDADVNVIGLLSLMEAGKKGFKRVIFASSGGAIYGEADTVPTPEFYKPQPLSPYGISKLTSEYYLYFYYHTYGISYVSLRYGNIYGPRQNPHGEAGVIAIFTTKMLHGVKPTINGDGMQSRDFVFVSDVVEANVSALKKDIPLIVNIGTQIPTTVNEIFSELKLLTKAEVNKIHGPGKKGEQKTSVLLNNLAKEQLGWLSHVTLRDGLTRTVGYFSHE
ncbi:MAG: NAD-dependent epimerase/dehydratase family protein [Patescibacteria group bacterium]